MDRVLVYPVSGCCTDLAFPCKTSDESLDYGIDLWGWLILNKLTLASFGVSTTDNLKVVSQGFRMSGTIKTGVTVELNGGNPGSTETILFQVTTIEGRTLDIQVQLAIQTLPGGLQPPQPTEPGVLTIGNIPIFINGSYVSGF